MVANTFHNCSCSGVSNTESLANKTIDKDLARCRPVTNYVSCNHVLFRSKCCTLAWPQHYFSTRKTLAQIVIRVTEQRQRNAARYECAETLAGRAIKTNRNGVVWQTATAPLLCHCASEHCADRAIDVSDWTRNRNGNAIFNRRTTSIYQFGVERVFEAMLLCHRLMSCLFVGVLRNGKYWRDVQATGLPM